MSYNHRPGPSPIRPLPLTSHKSSRYNLYTYYCSKYLVDSYTATSADHAYTIFKNALWKLNVILPLVSYVSTLLSFPLILCWCPHNKDRFCVWIFIACGCYLELVEIPK